MTFISSKIVRIRKAHNCWGCGKEHAPGSLMECWTGIDGTICSSYWCAPCLAYYNACEIGEDGISCRDFDGDPNYRDFLAALPEDEKVFRMTTIERDRRRMLLRNQAANEKRSHVNTPAIPG